MEQVDINLAVEQLKTYKQTKEEIAMKESKLTLLDESHIKTSTISDDIPGGSRKDIHDRYADMLDKKDYLKIELIELKLEITAVDTALSMMESGDKLIRESAQVIRMRHIEDKSLIELELELNMSESTVRRRLNRGEKEFARLLKLAM